MEYNLLHIRELILELIIYIAFMDMPEPILGGQLRIICMVYMVMESPIQVVVLDRHIICMVCMQKQ